MLQCTALPAENNWTNIDFYVAIIVSFSITRNLYAQLFVTIPLFIYRLEICLKTNKQTKPLKLKKKYDNNDKTKTKHKTKQNKKS